MLEPHTNQWLIVTLLVLLALAVAADIRTRRISNRIVMIGLVLGVSVNVSVLGGSGLVIAAGGVLVGLLCLLPFYLSGGMGAGDVKLMVMCGSFLGPVQVGVAATLSLVIGGVIGVVWFFRQSPPEIPQSADTERPSATITSIADKPVNLHSIPYAIAIAAGVVATLMAMPAISNAL